MGPVAWAALAAAVWWAMPETKEQRGGGSGGSKEAMQALIRRVADASGVPRAVALAFAEVESNFDPKREGDLDWATNKRELYRKLILDNPAFASNPARGDARAWHSYGLYQLLAPYHARPSEHPRLLLDPETNAVRGVTMIRGLLRRTNDVAAARLAYVGCGVDGSACSQATQHQVLARFAPVYQRWAEREGTT